MAFDMSSATTTLKIRSVSARDIRFPTSSYGEKAPNTKHDPDYSCCYVVVFTNSEAKGIGLCGTHGRGTEILVLAVKSLSHIVVGRELMAIVKDFGKISRRMTNDAQFRWLGPEKGVIHIAAGAIMNAIWDVYSRVKQTPLWKLLVDMPPEELVDCLDFTHIEDALTREEAMSILKQMDQGKGTREEEMTIYGHPFYSAPPGGLGMDDAISMRRKRLSGIVHYNLTWFKFKVGQNLEQEKRMLANVRATIGPSRKLVLDASQAWGVDEAIENIKEFAEFNPLWVEEPTCCDDILGHAKIAKAIRPLGIGVATGENCHNRIMFKQFFKTGAAQCCIIDPSRLAGINEVIVVMLLAKKFDVPVSMHASGLGLSQMIPHMAIFNYIAVSGDKERNIVGYVDRLNEHFTIPPDIRGGAYMPPIGAGYGVEMLGQSVLGYQYPHGPQWQELFKWGVYADQRKFPTP